MAVTAQEIIDRVRTQLIDNDDAGYRWTDDELLSWLSDGQRAVIAFVPDASSVYAVMPLAAGTKQSIPSGGHMLLSVIRNTNATGDTPGRAVRITNRELMDGFDPDWHTASATITARQYVFDPQQPDVFFVHPPNTGAGYVEISYSVIPGDITSLSDTLDISDIYQPALTDYVLYRAHQKDGDFSAGQGLAQSFLQSFLAHLGQEQTAELGNNPNLQLVNGDPSVKGAAK